MPPVCPAFPLGLWLCPLGRGGQVVAGFGGPQTVLNSPSQLSCQGQSFGRWMTSLLADLARRRGTAISCRRMVAVVVLAWNTDATAPAFFTPVRSRFACRGSSSARRGSGGSGAGGLAAAVPTPTTALGCIALGRTGAWALSHCSRGRVGDGCSER